MIVVNQDDGGLWVVHQPDHAAVSAQLARAWRRPRAIRADTWRRFLVAVRHHDDGWIDAERRPLLNPDGRPYDFLSLPVSDHINVWRSGITLTTERDPYAGLLVARHALWLYTHYPVRADKSELGFVEQFTSELNQQNSTRISELTTEECHRDAVSPDILEIASELLALFDALSLALLNAIPWINSSDKLISSSEPITLTRTRTDDNRVIVKPWPFRVPTLKLHTFGRRLAESRFSDGNHFIRALRKAPKIQLDWILRSE